MGNLLNPNYLNIPEQVEANTRKLEGSKIYKTTLNLNSGTSSIPIETTNIDDIKKVIEDSVIFSANGLMFLIKAFTTNSVLVEFYADLSSVNYLITQFDFETENIIYQDDSAEFKGEIKYADDELTGEKIAPANIKLKIKGGNQITIDVDESGKILIIKIDEDFLSQIEETIELSSENAQQLQRCLKTPISPPIKTKIVGVNSSNSQILIDLDDSLSNTSENPVQNNVITNAVNLNMLGVPTARYLDISSYVTEYIAPANGYICVRGQVRSGENYGFVGIINNTTGFCTRCIGANALQGVRTFLPVKKDDNITIEFSASELGSGYSRFYYAEELYHVL